MGTRGQTPNLCLCKGSQLLVSTFMTLTVDQMTRGINASVFVFILCFFPLQRSMFKTQFFILDHTFPRTLAVMGNIIINARRFASAVETHSPLLPPSNKSQTVICFATLKLMVWPVLDAGWILCTPRAFIQNMCLLVWRTKGR